MLRRFKLAIAIVSVVISCFILTAVVGFTAATLTMILLP